MSRKINIQKIRTSVELCCAINGWSPSAFGRAFNGDPNFVGELKKSKLAPRPRRLGKKMLIRLKAFLMENGVPAPEGF